MFKQRYERLDEIAAEWTVDDHAVRASLKTFMHAWFEFCTTDSTRYQLMFQRTIPDFEPSDDADGVGQRDPQLDAVEFCRVVSRRSAATHPLLETEVPF